MLCTAAHSVDLYIVTVMHTHTRRMLPLVNMQCMYDVHCTFYKVIRFQVNQLHSIIAFYLSYPALKGRIAHCTQHTPNYGKATLTLTHSHTHTKVPRLNSAIPTRPIPFVEHKQSDIWLWTHFESNPLAHYTVHWLIQSTCAILSLTANQTLLPLTATD